jgi:hypothetical protein
VIFFDVAEQNVRQITGGPGLLIVYSWRFHLVFGRARRRPPVRQAANHVPRAFQLSNGAISLKVADTQA